METSVNDSIPYRATHPGFVLREELEAREIKQKDFATQIGLQASHLNEILKGKRPVTEEIALKLENALGIDYGFWLRMQNGYYYDLKRIAWRDEQEAKAGEVEQTLHSHFNLAKLYKRFDITNFFAYKRIEELGNLLMMKIESLHQQALAPGFFKRSYKLAVDERNLRTWVLLAWCASKNDLPGQPYKEGNAQLAAEEIAALTNDGTLDIASIKRILNGYGIGYHYVEKFERTPVDAYSVVVEGHPSIVVTYRYNDLDKLAFDVLHELGHITNHIAEAERGFINIDGVGGTSKMEREANTFAEDALIPRKVWREILTSGSKNLSPNVVIKLIAEEAQKRGYSPTMAQRRYRYECGNYQTRSLRPPKLR